MAVAATGAIYKSLVFDGEDSREYGVYITGEAVYNAPKRDIEMVAIPGRSGAFALDKGRFENIEVTYPAGIYADNEADFAEAVSDFRNFLCSRGGYCRLVDGYNPNEYRMAIYKSGLEVTPAQLRAGEFDITFDCKPQRWLMSGEAALDITSGDTLFNPTRFDASPLLELKGYGGISFNGYDIGIDNIVEVKEAGEASDTEPSGGSLFASEWVDPVKFNVGDPLIFGKVAVDATFDVNTLTGYTITRVVSETEGVGFSVYPSEGGKWIANMRLTLNGDTVPSGNTQTLYIATKALKVRIYFSDGTSTQESTTLSVLTSWGSSVSRQLYSFSLTNSTLLRPTSATFNYGAVFADSTIPVLDNPTYIDCDLGEAYRIDNGRVVSLNAYIDLGSDLPKLASGPNEITYDNTVVELKIAPRWWKI